MEKIKEWRERAHIKNFLKLQKISKKTRSSSGQKMEEVKWEKITQTKYLEKKR